MKKFIFLLIFILFSSLSLKADDYIHNVSFLGTKNKCIYNDYYVKGGHFYFRYLTSPNHWIKTSKKKYPNYVISGYQFDTNTSICSPEAYRILNLTPDNYYFLLAFTGLLVGLIILTSSIYLVLNVGGKR